MIEIDRRAALSIFLGAGAVLTTPASALAALRLPRGPMRLTRRLERGMSRGAQLVVTREWTVQFTRQGAGIAVSGRQISAKVDAPDVVAAIAKIEEQRSTDGMFPILLSETGAIVAAGDYVAEQDEAKALQTAKDLIETHAISAATKADQLRALSILQSSFSSLLDQLPSDLFFPVSEPVKRVQTMDLSDGMTGEFELIYHAQGSEQGDWLKHAQREVITRIGDSERRSREVWSMRSEQSP